MLSYCPKARSKHLVIQEIGEETVVYDRLNQSAIYLNPISVAVWQACDGSTEPAGFVPILQSAGFQDVSDDTILLAIEKLQKVNLLEDSNELPLISVEPANRRELLRGLSVGAVALAPVVTLIKVPSATAQSSQATPCDNVGDCVDAFPGTEDGDWVCTSGDCGFSACCWVGDDDDDGPPSGYVPCSPGSSCDDDDDGGGDDDDNGGGDDDDD